MNRRLAIFALATLLAAAAVVSAAGGVELFGKPLRGLSAVPLAEVSAGRHQDEAIRVSGIARKPGMERVTIAEGEATLLVQAEGFSLPEDLAGARVTAEGRVRKGEAGPYLAASGIEVRR